MRVYPSLSAPLLTRRESDPADVDAICQGLTARQRDVLAVLLQGKSNKAICRILNLAEPTVKNHVTAILKALKVTNRTEAVIKVTKAAVALLSFASTISGPQAFGRTPEL
jgi:DNA-binding NarL/FixJ family response regulator